MQNSEFKNFELSEANVLLLYKRCKATEQTTKPLTIKVFHPHLCGQDSPEITFDGSKIIFNMPIIYHMLGQLKAVHDGQSFMASKQGFTNYKGEKWTTKNSAVSALYALGVATTMIKPFINSQDMNFSVTDIRALKPRYPFDDPNYSNGPFPTPN